MMVPVACACVMLTSYLYDKFDLHALNFVRLWRMNIPATSNINDLDKDCDILSQVRTHPFSVP